MKIVDVAEIIASADAAALLTEDEDAPHLRIADHSVWQAVFAGTLARAELADLLARFYPVFAGPGRYAFMSKIGVIDRHDGTRLFQRLYELTRDPARDADAGWRTAAEAVGADPETLARLLQEPTAEAIDLIETVRRHGEQSSPAEAAAVAWVIDRQLPDLIGMLADALAAHYGVGDEAVSYLRAEAAGAEEAEAWSAHLMEKYFMPADPYSVFEARRAMREAGWAWTALAEAQGTA